MIVHNQIKWLILIHLIKNIDYVVKLVKDQVV